MMDYIKSRKDFSGSRVKPLTYEIQLLIILKKVTESGWIVSQTEVKQLLEFLGVSKDDIESSLQL